LLEKAKQKSLLGTYSTRKWKKREGPLEAVVVVLFLTDGSRHPFYFHRKNRRPTSRPGRRHTHAKTQHLLAHPLWLQQHNLLLLFFTCLNSRGAQLEIKNRPELVIFLTVGDLFSI
jgi:hypothetical protein